VDALWEKDRVDVGGEIEEMHMHDKGITLAHEGRMKQQIGRMLDH